MFSDTMCWFASKIISSNTYCSDFYQTYKHPWRGIIFSNDRRVHNVILCQNYMISRGVCNSLPLIWGSVLFCLRRPKDGCYSTSDDLSCYGLTWSFWQRLTSGTMPTLLNRCMQMMSFCLTDTVASPSRGSICSVVSFLCYCC